MVRLSSDMYDNAAFILSTVDANRLAVPFPSFGFNKAFNC